MSTPEPILEPDADERHPTPDPDGRDERDATLTDLDPVWRALSDPTRRAILDELRLGPRNTGALCDRFDHLSRHGVIKHLKALERANLVRVTVKGRERINHLNVIPIQQIYERWMRPYESYWASHLTRLADEITRDQQLDNPSDGSPGPG